MNIFLSRAEGDGAFARTLSDYLDNAGHDVRQHFLLWWFREETADDLVRWADVIVGVLSPHALRPDASSVIAQWSRALLIYKRFVLVQAAPVAVLSHMFIGVRRFDASANQDGAFAALQQHLTDNYAAGFDRFTYAHRLRP